MSPESMERRLECAYRFALARNGSSPPEAPSDVYVQASVYAISLESCRRSYLVDAMAIKPFEVNGIPDTHAKSKVGRLIANNAVVRNPGVCFLKPEFNWRN